MIVSIETIQASTHHQLIMFPRYYDETTTVRCCQFCKNRAPLTGIIEALCFFCFPAWKYCGLYYNHRV